MRFTNILTSSAHAFIVEDANEERRGDFVRKFVKGLNCEDPDIGNRPCGKCPSCIQVEAGTSMDVFHMELSGKTSYKVEDANPFIERLGMGSYGRHIIGVIDKADLLSETVQNKLLKTLEEPEEGAVIILAADNRDNLLDTVRSRCNVIRVNDFGEQDENDREAREAIVKMADEFDRYLFHEMRTAAERNIKTREDALELLDVLEDEYRSRMIEGRDMGEMVRRIDLIERARMDMSIGMSHGRTLKRLYLEIR